MENDKTFINKTKESWNKYRLGPSWEKIHYGPNRALNFLTEVGQALQSTGVFVSSPL